MARDTSPRIVDEEADSATRRRFNAIEPLNQLQDFPPGVDDQPTYIASDIPPATSKQRRRASSLGDSLDHDAHLSEKVARCLETGESLTGIEESVLYLAYGSNLASQTFLGKRGIKPLSQILVLVPELRLTFNLPGVPYAEPCFAATEYRNPDSAGEQQSESGDMVSDVNGEYLSEKTPLVGEVRELQMCPNTHAWNKPLVGVVYEVTLSDYAKIIATEGGGGGYRDIVVDCHAFHDNYKPTDPVPNHPATPPFKAHTLLSQAVGGKWPPYETEKGNHELLTLDSGSGSSLFDFGPRIRPKLNYAQPSARYLNLITTGASEHKLPVSYQEYLSGLHPYRITTFRQKIGKALMLALFGPFILFLFGLSKKLAGPDGRSPPWLLSMLDLTFIAMWKSYDCFFRGVFGDGERTLDT